MLVSVYIITFNRLSLLKRALASVKAQTYPNIEIVVVDDGSTDGTVEYLQQEMAQGSVRALFNEKNLGLPISRNRAIEATQGEFITGLDDDDYFLPQRVAKFIELWQQLQTQGQRVAGLFDSHLSITVDRTRVLSTRPRVSYQDLRHVNYIANQVFAPREHFIEAGLVDLSMPIGWEDWECWIRMAKRYGDFYSLQMQTYIVDASHVNRISFKPESVIRASYEGLCARLKPLTVQEQASLLAALHGYHQVQPRLYELWLVIKGGQFKRLLRNLLNHSMFVWKNRSGSSC